MEPFYPKIVLFEENALKYPLGEKLWELFKDKKTPVKVIESHNKFKIEEKDPQKRFREAKDTLVVGVKKDLRFQSCRPSADYRLVTSTSCPGKCQYCYLATNLGERVYLRVYVNLEEILEKVEELLDRSEKNITTFEASSSSDPVATEHLTGSLKKIIEFFAQRPDARLRVVTKFDYVEPLLDANHNKHTRFRFSLNAPEIVEQFEQNTANLEERLNAAVKIRNAGYPLGFILAPLMIFPGWKEEYQMLINKMEKYLGKEQPMTIELIMHRFTTRAKRIIEKRFPNTELRMNKEEREHKGFGKYVYPEEKASELKEYLVELIKSHFPRAEIEYFT